MSSTERNRFRFFRTLAVDDPLFRMLSTAKRGVLKGKEMESMRGPMNFSTNEECGFLLEVSMSPLSS